MSKNKIVVVEDEAFIRKALILATPWEKFDCEVVGEAKNGIEGMELIKRLKPDIVLTDIRMPEMDGISMIQNLLEHVESQYIIMSGYNDFTYAKKAIKMGVKDYLLKPIDDKEFEETLKKVVSLIQKQKESQLESQSSNLLKEEYPKDVRQKYVLDALAYIKKHYDEEITIKEVAKKLYISEGYLSKLFKTHTEYTFIEYVTDYRMKKAMVLLKDPTLKIYEVADKVGYKDAKYFSVMFKKWTGISPIEFRYGKNGKERVQNT